MENLTFRPGILNFELEWEMKHCLPEEETGCPIVSSSTDTGSQGYDEYASNDAEFSNAPAYVEAEKKCEHGREEKYPY
jgi:hypothetical protein